MTITNMSSDEARSKWREVIDTAVAGNHVVIERYGKPVAAVISHQAFIDAFEQSTVLREAAAMYQTAPWDWEALKKKLITEVKAELLPESKWLRPGESAHQEELPADYNAVPQAEASGVVHLYSPRLVYPEQAADFKKEIVAESPHAEI